MLLYFVVDVSTRTIIPGFNRNSGNIFPRLLSGNMGIIRTDIFQS
jgi:hypothetical protein